MRYDDSDQESTNIEDRRSQGGGEGIGGGGFPIQLGSGGMGLGTMLIVGAVMLLFGFNPLELLGGGSAGNMPQMPDARRVGVNGKAGGGYGVPGSASPVPASAQGEDPMRKRVAQVLKDTEDVWTDVFQSMGRQYTPPTLVLFSGATRTGCGVGQTAMGPFYCPEDQKVYIDLAFYDELKRRFHAPGDFAQAYVVAHEVGHHVQNLLGISERVQAARERGSQKQSNALSVRMELQADCFAGVWAARDYQLHKGRIQDGDVESGLNAASQIGDDTLQKQAQGYVVPDAFTHGTSAQRVGWFRQGMTTGDIRQCDTFKMADPQ